MLYILELECGDSDTRGHAESPYNWVSTPPMMGKIMAAAPNQHESSEYTALDLFAIHPLRFLHSIWPRNSEAPSMWVV